MAEEDAPLPQRSKEWWYRKALEEPRGFIAAGRSFAIKNDPENYLTRARLASGWPNRPAQPKPIERPDLWRQAMGLQIKAAIRGENGGYIDMRWVHKEYERLLAEERP